MQPSQARGIMNHSGQAVQGPRSPRPVIAYAVVSAALVILLGLHTRNAQWNGDFWEHRAVVRELSTHPFSPQHPQLLVDAPHAFSLRITWLSVFWRVGRHYHR